MSRSNYTLEKVVLKPGLFTSAAILDTKTLQPSELVMKGKFTSDYFDDDYFKGKDGVDRSIVYFKPDDTAVMELRKIFAVVLKNREKESYLKWEMKPIFSKDETLRLKLKFIIGLYCMQGGTPKTAVGFEVNDVEKILAPKGCSANVKVNINTYFNSDNETLGLYLTVTEIKF